MMAVIQSMVVVEEEIVTWLEPAVPAVQTIITPPVIQVYPRLNIRPLPAEAVDKTLVGEEEEGMEAVEVAHTPAPSLAGQLATAAAAAVH